jgi:hypothetical protein
MLVYTKAAPEAGKPGRQAGKRGNPAPETIQLDASSQPVRRSSNGRLSARTRLLTREHLDRRSLAAKTFDRLVASIIADLGGEQNLSTVQRSLVEAFASAVVTLEDMNTRLLLGQPFDRADHAAAISNMVRVAARIGTRRVPRDVTFSDLLREDLKQQRARSSSSD